MIHGQMSLFAPIPTAPGRAMRRELLKLCRTLKGLRFQTAHYSTRAGLARELRAAQFALLYLRRCGA